MALRAYEDRVALIKIESVYGTDPTPADVNAVQLMNSTVTPSAQKLERELDSPHFGANPFVNVGKQIELDGEVDLLGNATPGLASPYSALYRACAHSETLVAVPLAAPSGLAVADSTTGGTLPDATYSYRVSAVNPCGETLAATAATDTATGAGTSSMVISWSAVTGATHYRVYGRTGGSELLLAETTALTWTDTGAVTPLAAPAGSVPAANTTVGAIYAPIAKNLASVTVYFYWAGVLFKLIGARGYLDITHDIKTFGKAKVKLVGILGVPVDGEAPGTISWDAFGNPVAIETETWDVKLGVTPLCAVSVALSCNSEVNLKECSQSREVTVDDRKPTGTLRAYKDAALATFNPWSIADSHAITMLRSVIDGGAGRSAVLNARVQLEYPKPVDIEKSFGFEIPFAAIASGTGGDEYTLAFR